MSLHISKTVIRFYDHSFHITDKVTKNFLPQLFIIWRLIRTKLIFPPLFSGSIQLELVYITALWKYEIEFTRVGIVLYLFQIFESTLFFNSRAPQHLLWRSEMKILVVSMYFEVLYNLWFLTDCHQKSLKDNGNTKRRKMKLFFVLLTQEGFTIDSFQLWQFEKKYRVKS